MVEEKQKLEEVVLTRLVRLNANVQSIVTGLIVGLVIFVATNWLLLKGSPVGPHGEPLVGPHLALLSQFFIGYRVTFVGSLIGFSYGFGSGFLVGYFVARIYNGVVDQRNAGATGDQCEKLDAVSSRKTLLG
jgi:hypothetical protein